MYSLLIFLHACNTFENHILDVFSPKVKCKAYLHACDTFENHILDVFSPKVKCKAYLIVFLVTVISVSFPPISAEGNENLFHCFCKVYKHGSDGSFP